ncbi:uncharacterized protein LOC122297016 [Carya illinoinensis]|uniref:uncharacterized protein LOC122297016 n=1 Tax=Carya illinoinensis TaxID=32201 RepID=UPI001C71BC8F|nr:uncharacterized protein LOC122297016 [Carya illinoinensis]
MNTSELEECAVTMRGIWSRRNESMHGQGFKHPNTVVRGAKVEIINYKEVNTSRKEHMMPTIQDARQWRKPSRGTYKVNWDAALNSEAGTMGLGVLVRDYKGHVIGALRARRPLAGNALEAEAYGTVLAATFCRELGLKQLHLEGDSQLVINLLKGTERNWSLGGLLVEDAKLVLSSCGSWKVSHVRREGNQASHKLAKSALFLDDDVYDLEECPTCIQSTVMSELFSA